MLRILTLLISLFSFQQATMAALTIEITKGIDEALPIAVVPFGWTEALPLSQDIASIVAADLYRTGRFNPLPRKDMLAMPTNVADVNYQNWRVLDIPYAVIGSVVRQNNTQFVIKFRLIDVYREKQLAGFQYSASDKRMRKVAHEISDVIYEELTGERGAFNTQIAYVQVLPASEKKRYRLTIADSDKENARGILASRNPIMSPTWSPDNKKMAYVHLLPTGSRINIYDFERISNETVAKFEGINSAPAWSPDSKKLAMTLSRDGNAEIYIMELSSRKLKRLTNRWAIDTEPAWAPDGKSLIYTSERGGTAQLYQYTFATKKVKRLTFEGKQNFRASFAPSGKMMTFVHLTKENKYQIAVMEFESGSMRVLTESSLDESPSFAPNGSMIIYSTIYQGRDALSAVSFDGQVHNRFAIDGNSAEREPTWSSFLK